MPCVARHSVCCGQQTRSSTGVLAVWVWRDLQCALKFASRLMLHTRSVPVQSLREACVQCWAESLSVSDWASAPAIQPSFAIRDSEATTESAALIGIGWRIFFRVAAINPLGTHAAAAHRLRGAGRGVS